MRENHQVLRFIDLFCGGGFGARGAARAGANPIFAVDTWDIAAQTYKDNFPSADVVCSAIESICPEDVASRYKPDILLTSPECTSHSIARGARPACEKSRATAMGVVPWLNAIRPAWLVVENVRRMKKWNRHVELVQMIESHGYTVSDLYLNAGDFGAAQARKRMFLVCSRDGYSITKDDLIQASGKAPRKAFSIIDWSGRYPSQPLYKKGRAMPTLERAERAISELGVGIPFIVVYYGSDYAGGWQRLDAPLRTVTTIDRFGLVTWEGKNPFLRMLQPAELLNAMGVGLAHQLNYGTRRQKIKLCGNGVCAEVMEAVFRHIAQVAELNKSQVA